MSPPAKGPRTTLTNTRLYAVLVVTCWTLLCHTEMARKAYGEVACRMSYVFHDVSFGGALGLSLPREVPWLTMCLHEIRCSNKARDGSNRTRPKPLDLARGFSVGAVLLREGSSLHTGVQSKVER